ncbi:Ion channel [Trichostrongylus colubriformis]|uniref:Ion channel n=1 Tax=Trichostrongylus colubriformis TaxID=6319 RepID=A0AAN8ILQ1_TRICO
MHNLQQKSRFEKAKPFTLHCSLLLLVLVYAFAGGAIFNRLEAEAYRRHQEDNRNEKIRCVLKLFEELSPVSLESRWRNVTANRIANCYEPERDERSEWSFVTATLYGFGIVTTLGYNRIAPITYAGRLFCIVYGICGIPITMIIIANVGQYLNNFAGDSRRKLEAYRTQRRMSRASLSGKEYKESSIQVTSLALLIAFLIYVAMGALLLPALNGQIDFFNGLYFNFLCLTAIDFGQLVPTRVAFLPITFLYVCLGLAITTIAIDVGSEYMKKLHYLGKKMKDAASTKIWFGGKTLKVRDLLHAVGKKCGVEPGMIDALDLENVVERTIALQEGREPPVDTNEDLHEEKHALKTPPPASPENEPSESSSSEDSPFLPNRSNGSDLVIKNPVYHTLSNDMPMYSPPANDQVFVPPMEICRIEVPEEISDEEFEEPRVVVVDPPPALEDIQRIEPIPLVPIILTEDEVLSASTSRHHSRSVSPEDRVPKKFKEKKEMYGRDPRKLFETYQEEWDRLERLSDKRHGPRRKSVLNLHHGFEEHRATSSPSMHSLYRT